jgi:hypothetical protein
MTPFISQYVDRIIGIIFAVLFVGLTLRLMAFHGAEIAKDFRARSARRKAARQTTKGLASRPKFWRW